VIFRGPGSIACLLVPSLVMAQDAQEAEVQFGGGPWTRPKLTGDWGGLRNSMAAGGFSVDLDATYTFQAVAAGGWKGRLFQAASNEDDVGNTLSGDLKLELDTGKAGIWEGGRVNARVEGRTGRSVLRRAGSYSAVNNDALFPNVVDRFDEGALAVTELTLTQSIGGGVSLFGGLLNPAEGDENELAGSALSNATFFNSALLYSLVEDATVPNVSLGGGLSVDPSDQICASIAVFGSAETAGQNPFPLWHGTTFSVEATVTHSWAERPGAQTFGVLYGINARRTDISVDPRVPLLEVLQGRPLPETDRHTWAIYYNAHQFLSGAADGGWGLFVRLGLSDGNPNPLKWNAALGLSGIGSIPGRPTDQWGLGAFYLDSSDQALLKGLHVGNEVGADVFYRFVLTPWFHLTLDAQVVDSALPGRQTAWVLGLRTYFVF
jgi:porin